MYDVAQQREIMLDGIGDLEDVSDEAFLQEMWYSAYNCAGNGFMPEQCDGIGDLYSAYNCAGNGFTPQECDGFPGYPTRLCMRWI